MFFHKITIIALLRISFLPSSIMHSWIRCIYLGAYVRSTSGQSYDHLFVAVVPVGLLCLNFACIFLTKFIALHVFFLISESFVLPCISMADSPLKYSSLPQVAREYYITNGSKCNCTYKASSGFDRCEGLDSRHDPNLLSFRLRR